MPLEFPKGNESNYASSEKKRGEEEWAYLAPISSSAQPGSEFSFWMARPKPEWFNPPRADEKLEKLA
jgi:hypothetical protein